MALGINYSTSDPLDLVPVVKYDARAGRFARVDRVQVAGQWQADVADISQNFSALLDLENIEVGWMNFNTGGAPDFRMVPVGSDPGPCPGKKYKHGFRVMLKLGSAAAGDKAAIREWCSVAKVSIGAMDALHDAYKARGDGKLPSVKLAGVKAVTTGSGQTKSTNYAPTLEVVGWHDRPADLVFKPKSKPASNGTAQRQAPPATGSTAAPPPSQSYGQAQREAPGANGDFG